MNGVALTTVCCEIVIICWVLDFVVSIFNSMSTDINTILFSLMLKYTVSQGAWDNEILRKNERFNCNVFALWLHSKRGKIGRAHLFEEVTRLTLSEKLTRLSGFGERWFCILYMFTLELGWSCKKLTTCNWYITQGKN